MEPTKTSERIHRKLYRPETLTQPGQGIDRRTLLLGEAVRTRITTQEEDGTRHSLVIVGGAEQGDGYEKGDRPPLVIHEGKLAETDGREGVAILPYDAQTLRMCDGVFVDEEMTLGVGDTARNFGKVVQIDHVPSMTPNTQLTPAELAVTRLFEQYQPGIAELDRQYTNALNFQTPPVVMP